MPSLSQALVHPLSPSMQVSSILRPRGKAVRVMHTVLYMHLHLSEGSVHCVDCASVSPSIVLPLKVYTNTTYICTADCAKLVPLNGNPKHSFTIEFEHGVTHKELPAAHFHGHNAIAVGASQVGKVCSVPSQAQHEHLCLVVKLSHTYEAGR